ncbi:MAG TPA: hypothetical protein VFB62_13260, partial [Polyangiaceae bacterium]|nr:hypothetical protein [Polyangiaceae bacterium]
MRKGFVLLVALVGCRDLLGIDDFTPPAEREPAIDVDTPVSGDGGAGGAAGETAPKLLWWRALGGRADDRVVSIALGAGGPVVGGVLDGVMDAGNGPIGQIGVRALFVLNLDAEGMPGASFVSQGPGSVERALMAIAPDGSTVVAASYQGAIAIGGSTLPDPSPGAGLAVAVIETGGNVRFAVPMSSAALEPLTLTVDAGGAIALGGKKRGTFVAGTTTLPGGTDEDALLVKLSAQGEMLFARDYRASGDADDQALMAARFDASGVLHVAGTFAGDLALSGTPVNSRGLRDAFVATVDEAGNGSLSAQLGGGSASVAAQALVFAQEGVVVAATAEGDFEVGAPLVGHGETDIVIAAIGGESEWAARFGGSGPDFVHALERAPDGGLLVGASFSADFATVENEAPITSAGEQDALVFALSSAGDMRWARRFGRQDNDAVFALALDEAGGLLLAGSFREAAALDG